MRKLKTIVFNLVLVTAYVGSGIWAVRDESWFLLALLISTLAIYGFIEIWLKRRRIELDHDGQPVSGRDADRLAILELRAYEKNQRRITRQGDRSRDGKE